MEKETSHIEKTGYNWDILKTISILGSSVSILGFGVAVIMLLLRIQGDVSANSQKIADVQVDIANVQVDTTKSIERGLSEVNDTIAKLTVATIGEIFTNRQGIQDLGYRLTTVEDRVE